MASSNALHELMTVIQREMTNDRLILLIVV